MNDSAHCFVIYSAKVRNKNEIERAITKKICTFAAMKRLTLLSILFLLGSVAHLTAQPKYEVRAVWLTTIGGIDWPHTYARNGIGIAEQPARHEYHSVVARLSAHQTVSH